MFVWFLVHTIPTSTFSKLAGSAVGEATFGSEAVAGPGSDEAVSGSADTPASGKDFVGGESSQVWSTKEFEYKLNFGPPCLQCIHAPKGWIGTPLLDGDGVEIHQVGIRSRFVLQGLHVINTRIAQGMVSRIIAGFNWRTFGIDELTLTHHLKFHGSNKQQIGRFIQCRNWLVNRLCGVIRHSNPIRWLYLGPSTTF